MKSIHCSAGVDFIIMTEGPDTKPKYVKPSESLGNFKWVNGKIKANVILQLIYNFICSFEIFLVL